MKRRVLRQKANKRCMRIINASQSLRSPCTVLLDASFVRAAADEKQTELRPSIGEALGSPLMRLCCTKSTIASLEKTAPKAVALLQKQAECIDSNETEAKREGRSVVEAASKLAASARHVFVGTLRHDTKKELLAAFPRPVGKGKEGAVPRCSLLRSTPKPYAVWLDLLHDIGKSEQGRGAPAAAAAASAAPLAVSASPADLAFMRSKGLDTTPIAPPKPKPPVKETVDASGEDGKKNDAAAEASKQIKMRKIKGANPLSMKAKAPKVRLVVVGTPAAGKKNHSGQGGAAAVGEKRGRDNNDGDREVQRKRQESGSTDGNAAGGGADAQQKRRRQRNRKPKEDTSSVAAPAASTEEAS